MLGKNTPPTIEAAVASELHQRGVPEKKEKPTTAK
jgi:hypothetical protein